MFNITRSSELDEFANTLATDIEKRYPPSLDNTPSKHPSVNRLTRIMEDICQKASIFQSTHRLGWINKARLANKFRWKLKDMGYSEKFIEFATEAIIVHMNK